MNQLDLLAILLALVGSNPIAADKASCGDFPALGFDSPEMSRFVGEYSNPNYDFGVRIPDGLVGHSSPPPMPHHGFGVVLSWEPRVYISFDGSYTVETPTSATPSFDQVQAQTLNWVREESDRVISVRKTRTRLGSLPARRHVVYRTCANRPGVFVVDEVIALLGGVTFSATLLSVDHRYMNDRDIFERFLRTWHVTGVK
jgi:hypothetical protein